MPQLNSRGVYLLGKTGMIFRDPWDLFIFFSVCGIIPHSPKAFLWARGFFFFLLKFRCKYAVNI